MEFLPNEVRYLFDSNVIRRMPDRLLPPGTTYSDFITRTPRSPEALLASEFFIEPGGNDYLWEKAFFERYDTTCSGCQALTIGGRTYHAALHKLDYVRVWDVPAAVKIPDFKR